MDHWIDLCHRWRCRCHTALRPNTFVGINWGSTNFRALLIGSDGAVIDEYAAPAGVVGLDRDGMAAMMDELASRWPQTGPVYASGMIGSNVGWIEVPYDRRSCGLRGV